MHTNVGDVVAESPLSASAIATLAGISPSTLARILAGTTSPTIRTLDAIARATGYTLDATLSPVQSEEAHDTFARLYDGQPAHDGNRWAHLLWDSTDSIVHAATLTARHSQLTLREGARRVQCPQDFFNAATWVDVAATNTPWFASGPMALHAAGLNETGGEHIFYTTKVDQVAGVLSDNAEHGAHAWILPLTPLAGTGTTILAPLQRWVRLGWALVDTMATEWGHDHVNTIRTWEEAQ